MRRYREGPCAASPASSTREAAAGIGFGHRRPLGAPVIEWLRGSQDRCAHRWIPPTLGSGEFVFASTIDVLRAHPAFDRTVDRDALTLYFRHRYVPAPWSIVAGPGSGRRRS